jgi:hypothetical protein
VAQRTRSQFQRIARVEFSTRILDWRPLWGSAFVPHSSRERLGDVKKTMSKTEQPNAQVSIQIRASPLVPKGVP